MKILSELHTEDISILFEKFESLIGSNIWCKIAAHAKSEIKGASYLSSYLLNLYNLAFTLTALSMKKAEGKQLPDKIETVELYEAYTFIAQVVNLSSQFDAKQQKSFIGRVRGSFKNVSDLKALQFELLIATHLTRFGFKLDFPEHLQIGNFDWICTMDELELEVECKFISVEKGRQIDTRHILETQHMLKIELQPLIKQLSNGLFVRVRLLPSEKLSTYIARKALVKEVKASILANGNIDNSFGRIDVSAFSIDSSPFGKKNVTESELQTFMKSSFNSENKQIMCIYAPNKKAFILSIEGDREDTLVEEAFSTIKDAARRQLSGKRPAILCVKFEGLNHLQLEELGTEIGAPSALRIHASKFMNNINNKHVVSLAFFADGELSKSNDAVVTRDGAVYSFSNDKTQWGDDARFKVFNSAKLARNPSI